MAYDSSRSDSNWKINKTVAAAASVPQEGVLLTATLENGVEVVQPSNGSSATQKLVGFAVSDNSNDTEKALVVTTSVPSDSPYTVQLAKIPLGSPGSMSVSVRFTSNNTALSQEANTGAVNGSGKFHCDAAGLVTFHSADASKGVVIQLRHALTAEEAVAQFYSRSVNNAAGAQFGLVCAMGGTGQIFTMAYDAAINWAGSVTPKTADNGFLTSGGGGTAVNCHVIKVPTDDDPYLGLEFTF